MTAYLKIGSQSTTAPSISARTVACPIQVARTPGAPTWKNVKLSGIWRTVITGTIRLPDKRTKNFVLDIIWVIGHQWKANLAANSEEPGSTPTQAWMYPIYFSSCLQDLPKTRMTHTSFFQTTVGIWIPTIWMSETFEYQSFWKCGVFSVKLICSKNWIFH